MKPERIVFGALLVLMVSMGGCASIGGIFPYSEENRNLNEAVSLLRTGKERQARNVLQKIADGAPVAGVTDEALFRLALLNLRLEGERGDRRSQALLERLAEKYPDSIWTRQSAPLLTHLADVMVLHDRQRELKTLKGLNLSLSRDNSALRQSLEQLKQLDLDLEKRIKH